MMASSCGVRMMLGFRMATKYVVFSRQCQGVGPGVSLGRFVSFVRSLVRWFAGSLVRGPSALALTRCGRTGQEDHMFLTLIVLTAALVAPQSQPPRDRTAAPRPAVEPASREA